MRSTFRRNGPLALFCLVIVLAAGLYASKHHRDDNPPAPSTSTATPR
jgi:hypothetical protein